jgi:hypothetical protein
MRGGEAGDGGGRGADYRVGRLAVVAALTVTVMFLLVNDAVRQDYQIDGIILASLLGAIVTLLGIEIVGWRR